MGTSKKGRWALNGGNSNVWNANSQESGQKQGFTWQEKLLQIVNIGYIKEILSYVETGGCLLLLL
jgi:hypothetical protein